jgi:hypothetical protein
MNSFDTVIVGGGLTGLFLAHRLHHSGKSVALFEAREMLGGRYRRPNPTLPYSSPGLDFIPATQEDLAVLEWLKNVSPVPLNIETREHHPLLFDEGRWRPFVGFGESEFASIGELSSLSRTQELLVTPGLEQLTRALVEQLPIDAHTLSEVTGFKTANGRVSEVTVNGDKSYRADRFIFTGYPTAIAALLPDADLSAKHRTRLAKMESWTAVTLDIRNASPLADDSSIRIFTHSAKEFQPVFGRAHGLHSKWMTLVPGERGTEHEFVGQCIRHIKRQLKRAWPQALEGDLQEKIFVQPNAFGQHSLKTKEVFRWPELPNLYLANHGLSALANELGALEVAKALEIELLGPLNQLPELGASC